MDDINNKNNINLKDDSENIKDIADSESYIEESKNNNDRIQNHINDHINEHNHKKDEVCKNESSGRGSNDVHKECRGIDHDHGKSCGCNIDHDHVSSCGCEHAHNEESLHKSIIFLVISLASLIVSFLNLEMFHYVDPAWIAVILCGFPIFKAAFTALKNERKITSSLLISVAIIASIGLEVLRLSGMMGLEEGHGHGYIFAAGEIAILMALGGFIEDWTVRKARSGIEKLMKLAPKTVYLKTPTGIEEINVSDIKIGDMVVVKPGDIIGVDGTIAMGSTSVDQSSVTGEAMPVDKIVGDLVYSGTQNKNGAIEVYVTKEPKDMTVNKLIALVEEAEGKKSPIARLADKWASYIVPTAMVIALAVFALSYFAFGITVVEALIRGVTILVVFCPCSLSLATPTAVAAGIGNGSGRGMLIKSGAAIEELARVKTVAFDKTGTLTEGNMKVSEVFVSDWKEEEFIALMGAAESYSDHPIAKAITKYAIEKLSLKGENFGLDRILATPEKTEALLGVGTKAMVGSQEIILCAYDKIPEAMRKYVENYQSFQQYKDKSHNIEMCFIDKSRDFMNAGYTVIGGIIDGKLVGIIGISDTLREGSKDTVIQLRNQGYQVVMLTGDHKKSAEIMAAKAGDIDFQHSLLPEDKLNIIEELKKNGKVCMVGDGINDTPALATADASIAMGALGSDSAIETADVSLMTGDIRKVPELLDLSKIVLRTIKRNIGISMSINTLAVIFSTLGLLTPVTGAIVHNVSSVIVVLSSAWILTKK